MFTGIITDIGTVRAVEGETEVKLTIGCGFDTSDLAIGASVACSGACLTVTEKGEDWFRAIASAETLAKTTLGDWREGTEINLERALRAGDELGGHLVSGHVDGTATVTARAPVDGSVKMAFEAPDDLKTFIAPKGSVTLDGVSLTVNDVDGVNFTVNVIPHTLEETTLKDCKPGDRTNLEIDLLARYVARLRIED